MLHKSLLMQFKIFYCVKACFRDLFGEVGVPTHKAGFASYNMECILN